MVGVLIQYIAEIEDMRQRYTIEEILVIVLFAMLGNANEWEEIKIHEKVLKKYLSLKMEFHHTIQ